MSKTLIYRNLWLGFLSWMIPFAVSFICYSRDGQLLLGYGTFKSIMVITGTVSGSFLLYHYFAAVNSRFVFNGLIVGLSWFTINVLLDTIILVPMMKTSFSDYFLSIGAGYISIPAISIAIGYALHKKIK